MENENHKIIFIKVSEKDFNENDQKNYFSNIELDNLTESGWLISEIKVLQVFNLEHTFLIFLRKTKT